MYELLMERVMNSKLFLLLTLLGLICSATQAATKVISVNYVKTLGSDEEISGVYGKGEWYDESQVNGWINTVEGNVSNATLDDGRQTGVNITTVRPVGNGTANNSYYDSSPLHAWVVAGAPAGKEAHATIENLNEVFPNGYKIIVYLNGHQQVGNARIYLSEEGGPGDFDSSNDSYYSYKTYWSPSGYSGTPSVTTQNTSGTVPLAQYAVFGGGVTPGLSADKVTLTLDTIATSGGGAGLSGFQIIGDVDDAYSFGAPALPAGAILYNDFSNYQYKDYSLAAGGTANPTYHNRKNGKYIGGSSKGVFVLAKRNPYIWNDSSTWFVNHSYAFKFGDTNATNPRFVAPVDSTGGTALKVGYHGPRASTGSIILNTGIKFDPTLNYTVTLRAKIKDEVDSAVISNAVGNVSLSAGFGNLARLRNQYAVINQASTNGLSTTNWTEVSVNVYGGKLGQNAVFGENAFASGFGPNGRHHRIPNNSLNLASYFPQELMISIGRSPNSTNTLDHSTWVDWIKIETNNYLASIAASYGLSETNLLIDSDADGQSDLTEIATGGDPVDDSVQGVGLNIVSFADVIRPIYATNNIGILPNQNENGEVPVIVNYPKTNFSLSADAKYGATNLIASSHRFQGNSWTNYEEYAVKDTLPPVIAVKWKETVEEVIDLSLSNYTFNVITLNDNAHYLSNNIYEAVEISGFYTNSLDNGIDVISQIFTNEISVTKTGTLEVVGYKTNSIVRFKRPRSKLVNELGCKYSVASRENLSFGSWTNSGAYNFGDIYTASNFPNTEIGISTVTADENTKFIKLKVTSPQNDPSTFYFDTFSETDYGNGDPGN